MKYRPLIAMLKGFVEGNRPAVKTLFINPTEPIPPDDRPGKPLIIRRYKAYEVPNQH